MPEASPWKPNSPLFIGIAGGSGAGKTTFAQSLVDVLGGDVAVIQHDSYYLHSPEIPFEVRARANYDHPDSLETELLVKHLVALRAGESIERPVYDFSTHLRSDRVVVVEAAPVVLVEGILVLADPDLRLELDLKIFVDTAADVRLARRLRRDIEERGRTVESVISQYFDTVRPMHLEFVEASKKHADIIIEEGYDARAVAKVVELIRSRSR